MSKEGRVAVRMFVYWKGKLRGARGISMDDEIVPFNAIFGSLQDSLDVRPKLSYFGWEIENGFQFHFCSSAVATELQLT